MEREFNAYKLSRSMYPSIFNSFRVIRCIMHKSENRYFYHIFVSPGDAPGAITLNVVWMEREFDAYKLSRSMYPSIFNSFRVIRCIMHKSENRYFYHIFVSPGDAPGAITLNVIWMEREFDAFKLPRCMCPSNYNRFWDTARYWLKIVNFFIPPLHSTPPLRGFPLE